MNALSKLSAEILIARRERDATTNPEAFRLASLKVQGVLEAWRTIALKGAR